VEEISRIERTPTGLPAVQQPPALAALLEQHPPTDATLLQIEQHLNSGEITGEGIGHGHGAEGPAPKAAPRQGWPRAHATGSRQGKESRWGPARVALARGSQHGKGRGASS
jgi:hypothetical protein